MTARDQELIDNATEEQIDAIQDIYKRINNIQKLLKRHRLEGAKDTSNREICQEVCMNLLDELHEEIVRAVLS